MGLFQQCKDGSVVENLPIYIILNYGEKSYDSENNIGLN